MSKTGMNYREIEDEWHKAPAAEVDVEAAVSVEVDEGVLVAIGGIKWDENGIVLTLVPEEENPPVAASTEPVSVAEPSQSTSQV